MKILEKLQEHVLQEVFNIVEIIEYRNKIYNDPTMLTTKLLPWIEQLAPPAKNKLAQIIFDNAERIQDLQSMKHCRIVIDALTVEDAALRRFLIPSRKVATF